MANPYLFTSTFESITGFPEDRVVTTFPVLYEGAGVPVQAEILLALAELGLFWTGTTHGASISTRISGEMSRTSGDVVLRAYDLAGALDGSAHGSPVAETTTTLDAPAVAGDLPGECAIVLTTRATGWASAPVETADGPDPGTEVDRPMQRLSGRNFIGPLNGAASEEVGGITRPAEAFRTDLIQAADTLSFDLQDLDFRWCVWSRVNEALVPLTHVQVDNAFDTQRRRGAAATIRTTFALTAHP